MKHSRLFFFAVVMGLIVTTLVCVKAFGFASGMSPDEMQDAVVATPDYGGVLLVNLLIGISVWLLVVELRWDALRVMLTVAVALLFGYLMTTFFNLDASKRFIQGQFRVSLLAEAAAPGAEAEPQLRYGDRVTAELNDPRAETPITEGRYRFVGRAGDIVSVLAFAEDDRSGLDMQVTLFGPDGAVLQENQNATRDQQRDRDFRRYLQSETDAVIERFALPADGFYAIVAQPETASADMNEEFSVALLSDNPPPVDMSYGADPVGGEFNAEDAARPLKEASYRFAGSQGDMVTVLGYVAQANVKANLQVFLRDASGALLGQNNDASPEQVAQYPRLLKSTDDAALVGLVLPADGIYTITVRPEPLTTAARFRETLKATNDAYNAFLFGPLSRLNRWVEWIRDAITLIILGLAIAIVFRAEQFSLGAEGQIYFGALVSGSIGLAFGDEVSRPLLVPIALLSAATAGFLWGLLPGALKAYLGANELVSTLMLNTIATRFYDMVLTFQLKPPEAGYTASDWIPEGGLLPRFIVSDSGDQVSIAVFFAVVLVLLAWLLIYRTPIGYEIRMIGANIKFADYGGVNTRRTIMLTMAISGAVAGLAGAHLAMGVHRKLILNISVGLAFEGVVVALLARNNLLVVPFTGLLYAYLRTGAQMMERDADISSEVVRIIQAIVILLITAEALVTFFRRRRIRRRGTVELDLPPDSGAPAPAAGGDHG